MRKKSNCIRYIEQHYAENIDNQILAKTESYNPNYFNFWFRRHYGCTPGQYVRNVRLDAAAALLQSTNFPVAKVARMVGYKSPSSFVRAFRKRYQTCPSSFQQDGSSKRP